MYTGGHPRYTTGCCSVKDDVSRYHWTWPISPLLAVRTVDEGDTQDGNQTYLASTALSLDPHWSSSPYCGTQLCTTNSLWLGSPWNRTTTWTGKTKKDKNRWNKYWQHFIEARVSSMQALCKKLSLLTQLTYLFVNQFIGYIPNGKQ